MFEDLTRSGITSWEFRSCVKFDVNFIEEFKRQIDDANIFLLVDSNESRKGEYVKMEVVHALDRVGGVKLVPAPERIVANDDTDPAAGAVRWAPMKSLWLTVMMGTAL